MRSSVRLRRCLGVDQLALDHVVALGVGVEQVGADDAYFETAPPWATGPDLVDLVQSGECARPAFLRMVASCAKSTLRREGHGGNAPAGGGSVSWCSRSISIPCRTHGRPIVSWAAHSHRPSGHKILQGATAFKAASCPSCAAPARPACLASANKLLQSVRGQTHGRDQGRLALAFVAPQQPQVAQGCASSFARTSAPRARACHIGQPQVESLAPPAGCTVVGCIACQYPTAQAAGAGPGIGCAAHTSGLQLGQLQRRRWHGLQHRVNVPSAVLAGGLQRLACNVIG